MAQQHIHFVTGKLAEFALRQVVEPLSREFGFDYSIGVLKISVAALMTADWIAKHISVPGGVDRIIVTGYCEGDLTPIETATRISVERGPRDVNDLPDYFGAVSDGEPTCQEYDIEVLAEINFAPRLSLDEIVTEAESLRTAGADVIDLGCEPGETWAEVGPVVQRLVADGFRVSIDSMNSIEIGQAALAGAELVLSVNRENRDAAPDWGCEVVVIPDRVGSLDGLEETLELLEKRGVPHRIDPILEPIGMGFAESLGRYMEVRRRWPSCEMLLGIGNLTELTDADSAPINVILLGFCQELAIRSVLTTQVINWTQSSVTECDLARRLVHHAVTRRTLPKHLEPRLVMLRDPKLSPMGREVIDRLATQIKDNNYRIFAEESLIHLLNAQTHLSGEDPFEIFEELQSQQPGNLDAAHAFYLGYEMSKAATALTLGKQYRQDEALDWGFLTQLEKRHRLKFGKRPVGDDMPSDSSQNEK